MGTTPDVAALLRQRDLMNQLQQTTAQGTQVDLLQPGIRAFSDTGGGQQTQPQRRGGGLVLSALTGLPLARQRGQTNQPTTLPGLSQIEQAKQRLGTGITGLMTGQGTAGFKAPPTIQPGSVYQEPSNPPTLIRNTPPGQPIPGRGQALDVDPNTGQTVVVPRPGIPPAPSPALNPQQPTDWTQNPFNPSNRQYNPNGLLGQ